MKKELIIGVTCAVLGSASTVGFDILKSKYFKTNEPLSKGVTELSHISKELILEQKALNNRIALMTNRSDIPQNIKVGFGDIINRVNNIVQTSVHFEAKSRDVTGIALSMKSRNANSSYNSNADLILSYGQAVTVCGNENTLGVETESGRNAVIYLNDTKRYASVGEEYTFMSPMGPSLVSYLGKNSEQYEFRIVCGTQVKKT
ncbi:hypothetical protein CWB76_06890 [Pseudoalteromonas sp. S1609]|uniref:hypothetical protein n=1 Tax=Pseudoalteromonas sp. S1609 TaxID=579505 RepID=UPI00110B073A|nr:hypothetical protein [Pseudoalteromonas sp. S1609]TMP71284.1 hypothetical protein CWB76_06890 [Pseudoalteromonas sp. S1609]|tara:strand:+ start:2085 stop:2693 length:609 start_codon:yes stop_codon:yes gene_type:complete